MTDSTVMTSRPKVKEVDHLSCSVTEIRAFGPGNFQTNQRTISTPPRSCNRRRGADPVLDAVKGDQVRSPDRIERRTRTTLDP